MRKLTDAFEKKFSNYDDLESFSNLIMEGEILTNDLPDPVRELGFEDFPGYMNEFGGGAPGGFNSHQGGKKPCFNFKNGNCKFGDGCRYSHAVGSSGVSSRGGPPPPGLMMGQSR